MRRLSPSSGVSAPLIGRIGGEGPKVAGREQEEPLWWIVTVNGTVMLGIRISTSRNESTAGIVKFVDKIMAVHSAITSLQLKPN